MFKHQCSLFTKGLLKTLCTTAFCNNKDEWKRKSIQGKHNSMAWIMNVNFEQERFCDDRNNQYFKIH